MEVAALGGASRARESLMADCLADLSRCEEALRNRDAAPAAPAMRAA
jgi:hypothetical protein